MKAIFAVLLCGGILYGQTGAAASTDLYYLVFLRRVPDPKPLAQAEGQRMQAAHMANIRSMAERGILVAAGPFGDTPPTISGLFLFKTASLDEARRVAEQDPTVVEHRNTVEAFPWRGPRGIGSEYFRLHKENPQTPEDMGVHPLSLLYRATVSERGDRAQILKAHADYVAGLWRDGKLAASGPIEGDYDLAEILIFNRIPPPEAERLTSDDPAVKGGLFHVKQHRWWSAAHVLPK